MHRYLRAALGLALLSAVALAAGCSGSGSESSGEPMVEVWGYVASAEAASLEVDEIAEARESIRVDSVTAPGPAWLVVHLEEDGMPGERVGLLHINEGTSTDVDIALDNVQGERVIVAVHADMGTKGEFDFDMMDKEMSADRPYFVDREELARIVTFAE